MASNLILADPSRQSKVCSHPATPSSGDPVRVGYQTGLALTDESAGGNATGYTSVDFGWKTWDVSVKAVDGSGSSAVADGDLIYYVDADTPNLSKKATGYLFGVAREAITGGATDTINVEHIPYPGINALGAGSVTTTQLGTAAVTADKLSSTLKTGFIDLPLSQWRIIATNDISAKNAADGGLVSLDTDPTFKRVNTSTDKALRLSWAATSVVEVAQRATYPPDLDDTATVVFHMMCRMGGAMDTPVVGISYFEGVGDTNAGGNTAALAPTTIADKTVTIAAADIGAYPNFAAIGITPAAHGNDAIEVYATWLEYTRK